MTASDPLRLVNAELFRYRLPLVRPLRLSFGTLTHREGALLRITAEDGTEGWGEAAPLPDFSPDTLADVLAEAPTLVERYREGGALMQGFDVTFAQTVLRPLGRSSLPFPPSLRYAESAALLDLAGRRYGWPLDRVLAHQLGTREAAPEVALQALLVGEPDEVMEQASAAREAGYRAVKLKVGHRLIEDDVALVRAVAAHLGETVELRLDANQAWPFEGAMRLAQALADVRITYVEEPLRHAEPGALRALHVAGLPVALDESLSAEMSIQTLQRLRFAEAIVLKPTLGRDLGFLQTWRRNVAAPMRFVVSAAFETAVGMRYNLALAAALGGEPAGLDTYRWLAEDIVAQRLPLDGPHVRVAGVMDPPVLTMDRLEAVTV